ncbi:MAG: cupin domain-containing protein [Pirellulales bacterium]|nr:cupin domain-containing protein [Pirellulales bacterium]
MPENLFADLPVSLPEELVETLVQTPEVRIERIVSTGHSSPPGYWYDQTEAEWVVLLCGQAKLELETPSEVIHLAPGDHINLPPGCRHRVQWTSPDEPTVWLAVFYKNPS